MTTRRWVLGSGAVAVSAAAAGIIAFRTSGLAQNLNLPEKLVNDPAVPILGNPMARITVTEFFDYRCPYCRTMQPVLHELLAKRNDVRLALRECPIFGALPFTPPRSPSLQTGRAAFPRCMPRCSPSLAPWTKPPSGRWPPVRVWTSPDLTPTWRIGRTTWILHLATTPSWPMRLAFREHRVSSSVTSRHLAH